MIRILSTMAIMGAMQEIAPAWEALTGDSIQADYAPTVALLDRLRRGETADAVFLTAAGIEDLIREGRLKEGSRVDVAVSLVGVAVKAGAAKPDISTPEALQAALLAARSVAWSRIGASGLFFADLIRRMRIEHALLPKAQIVAGFTAEKVANGEAELAIQQISELMVVPGIEIVGPLPEPLQQPATFSGGLAPQAAPAAADLLRFITSSEAEPALRRAGLQSAQRP